MAMASAALRASRRCAVRPCARGGHPTGLPKASARTTHGRRGWDARQAAQAGSGERPGRVLDPEPLARGAEEPQDDLWIHTGLVLLLGGLVPSLVGTRFVDEVRRAVLLCQLRPVGTAGV